MNFRVKYFQSRLFSSDEVNKKLEKHKQIRNGIERENRMLKLFRNRLIVNNIRAKGKGYQSIYRENRTLGEIVLIDVCYQY